MMFTMSNRIHDFTDVSLRIAKDRDVIRAMARAVTGDPDVACEERYAAVLDGLLGRDEVRVGAAMTYLLECSSDPREYTLRVLAACDLLRRIPRTAH
jgi:hypothetical protein